MQGSEGDGKLGHNRDFVFGIEHYPRPVSIEYIFLSIIRLFPVTALFLLRR